MKRSGTLGIGLALCVIAAAIAQQHHFAVLRTTGEWCGLTHPADAVLVRQQIATRP